MFIYSFTKSRSNANVGPIYKAKNVYSLMFMLVIIHRAYVLKLFLGIVHLDRNHGCLQD